MYNSFKYAIISWRPGFVFAFALRLEKRPGQGVPRGPGLGEFIAMQMEKWSIYPLVMTNIAIENGHL